MGDILTLVASVGYSVYQVLYKKYIALPNLPSPDEDDGDDDDDGEEEGEEDKLYSVAYSRLPNEIPPNSNASTPTLGATTPTPNAPDSALGVPVGLLVSTTTTCTGLYYAVVR